MSAINWSIKKANRSNCSLVFCQFYTTDLVRVREDPRRLREKSISKREFIKNARGDRRPCLLLHETSYHRIEILGRYYETESETNFRLMFQSFDDFFFSCTCSFYFQNPLWTLFRFSRRSRKNFRDALLSAHLIMAGHGLLLLGQISRFQ